MSGWLSPGHQCYNEDDNISSIVACGAEPLPLISGMMGSIVNPVIWYNAVHRYVVWKRGEL
jgi:hypothetical protein